MKLLILSLLVAGVAHAAEPVQVTVLKWLDIEIVEDLESVTTSTSYRYTFSAQQPVGQLQGAVSYSVEPVSLALSNDIAGATLRMLQPLGKADALITVVLP